MKPTLPALALVSLAPPAQADTRPTFWEAFTVENIATAAVHSVMSWARLLADIRYDQVSVDPVGMKATLTGVTVSPLIPNLPGRCIVTAERMTINGLPLDQIDGRRIRIALDNVTMGTGCVPFEVASMMRGFGFKALTAARVEADLTYDYPSGGLVTRISADLDKLASVEADIDFSYISYRMDFRREEPRMAADLRSARVSVQDRGAWDIAKGFMPAQMTQPQQLAAAVEGGLTQAMASAGGPGAAPTDGERAFAAAAGQVAAAFAEGRRNVVLVTQIDKGPLRLDERSARSFPDLFDRLNPAIAHSDPGLAQAIPVAELDAALKAETPPDNAFAIGKALITGIGAPKNVNGGIKLLLPLARNGNVRANLLIATEIAEVNPVDAYSHALRAAAAGLPGALALLDRIERRISFADALAAQKGLMRGPEEALYSDLSAMRSAARDFLTGTKRPRAWLAAYYWSSMAAAAGDAAGAALRDEVVETMRLRGDADAWTKEANSIDAGVLRDWIGKDVPSRLR